MRRGALPDAQVSRNTLAQRKYRANPANAEKDRIRSRVHRALVKGKLVKQPCFCGVIAVEAHHYLGYDLEHALDVVWLCKPHHERLHPQPNRMKGRTYGKEAAA